MPLPSTVAMEMNTELNRARTFADDQEENSLA